MPSFSAASNAPTKSRAASAESAPAPSFASRRSSLASLTRLFGAQLLVSPRAREDADVLLDGAAATPVQYDIAQIQIYPMTVPRIQAKLAIGEPNDAFEQEADRVAERVMRLPEPQSLEAGARSGLSSNPQGVQQKSEFARIQTKPASASSVSRMSAPPIVSEVLNSSGQPLDAQTRAYLEPRFGHDFSRVRIHTDVRAAESARAVNALAYTLGHSVVFGAGQFQPATNGGRRLIAHELTHVVQQSGLNRAYIGQHTDRRELTHDLHGNDMEVENGAKLPKNDRAGRLSEHDAIDVSQSSDLNTLRRAEVEDRDSKCSQLTDVSADVNNWVNQELTKARTSPGIIDPQKFFDHVFEKTAAGGNSVVTPIEQYIEKLPPSKRFLPGSNLAGTRYASQPALSMYSAQGKPFYIVGPTIKIGELCVGADKLGHLFQQGKQYFDLKYQPIIEALQKDPQSVQDPTTQSDLLKQGVEAAKSFGRGTEIDKAGLSTTGVYSNADLAANEAGLKFWDDLMQDPNMSFDVAKYATNQWNEYTNPNYYEESTGRNVWATQLSGSWKGSLQISGATQPVDVHLAATNVGTVSGTFTYPSSSSTPLIVTATITGAIAYKTTPVSGKIAEAELHGSKGSYAAAPISSVTIEFDWVSGSNNGKGVWNSSGENRLVGTYGNGSSRVDGGSFNIERIP